MSLHTSTGIQIFSWTKGNQSLTEPLEGAETIFSAVDSQSEYLSESTPINRGCSVSHNVSQSAAVARPTVDERCTTSDPSNTTTRLLVVLCGVCPVGGWLYAVPFVRAAPPPGSTFCPPRSSPIIHVALPTAALLCRPHKPSYSVLSDVVVLGPHTGGVGLSPAALAHHHHVCSSLHCSALPGSQTVILVLFVVAVVVVVPHTGGVGSNEKI